MNVKRIISTVVALSFLAIAGPGASARTYELRRPEKDPRTARQLLGDVAADILARQTTFEVSRIEGKEEEAPKGAALEGHPVIAVVEKLPEGATKKAAEILLADGTYNFEQFGQETWCGGFRPGVAFRFAKGDHTFVVLICFECDDLVAVLRDAQGKQVHATMVSFPPGRGALVALAKSVFPKDEKIQALRPEAASGDEE